MILSDQHLRLLCLCADGTERPDAVLSPYSSPVQGMGVVSFGETSGGYDLRLGHTVKVFKNTYNQVVSPKRFKDDPNYENKVFDVITGLRTGEVVIVPPHSYILAYSLERFNMPRSLKAHCIGKSTYARCGIIINTTPAEPAWRGHLTIEIANVSPCPVELFVGEGIAQVEFHQLTSVPMNDYQSKGGKYQDQVAEPVAARIKE